MTNPISSNAVRQHHHDANTPTAMLRHEHEVILRALRLLQRLGQGLEAGKPVNRHALAWLVDFFRTFVDRCHHAKEERHLYPALERQGIPRHGGPVGVMLYEHEQGRAFIRAMVEGNDQQLAEAIRGYGTLLSGHIEKENGILFPMAEQVLAEEEQHGLVQAFDAVEQEVVGPGIHERLLSELDRIETGSAG